MATTNEKTTLKGNPVQASGTCLKVGDALPLVTVTNTDLKDISLEEFLGKKLVVLSVPSLDTPVCQTEVRTVNQKLSDFSDDVAVVVVSRDLPFAQKRWCGAEGIERVTTLSDFKHRAFGQAFGTDLVDVGILSRAVFVCDKEGVLTHVDYVEEVADEPDYEAVFAALA